MEISFYKSPVGWLELSVENDQVYAIEHVSHRVGTGASQKKSPLMKSLHLQLGQYFAGRREKFDLPLAPRGTTFQQQVWKAMGAIPFGQVKSYGDLAKKVGKPGAARAVGGACNRNPWLVVVPCHRVVAANGGLGGFALGLPAKRRLLEIEKSP